jgi:hypothetical protein
VSLVPGVILAASGTGSAAEGSISVALGGIVFPAFYAAISGPAVQLLCSDFVATSVWPAFRAPYYAWSIAERGTYPALQQVRDHVNAWVTVQSDVSDRSSFPRRPELASPFRPIFSPSMLVSPSSSQCTSHGRMASTAQVRYSTCRRWALSRFCSLPPPMRRTRQVRPSVSSPLWFRHHVEPRGSLLGSNGR